ncbi:MAG: shikimate dehydrogenase [Gammaproteobacteria bacterium]|nr:shikimate dehydrogenase [Gammaproteobacteria bacterium]|tara:strand:- start:423 stop:1256 length:834 start_codon:yes stop_codon:yes gene_type:complete
MARQEVIKKYAVFGNPIEHSMSPLIHEYFAKNLKINLSYVPILGSLGKFEKEAKIFLGNGGSGFNVTLPFKEDAFKLAETKSKIARITGSVNTISIKNGIIHGDNTDGIGFVKDMKNNIEYDFNDKKILVVGAGGAAMGVIPSILNENPSELKIYNRTFEKAKALSDSFENIGPVEAVSQDKIHKHNFDLIINATSIGINNIKFELSKKILNTETVCYDMSYGKISNSFKMWSNENNLKFHDGLGMLLEQAAESFYIWELQRPVITEELKNNLKQRL